MFYGAGKMMVVSKDGKLVHATRPSKFKYELKSDSVKASGFPVTSVGPIQDLDEAAQKEEWTFSFTQESLDGQDLQLVLDQREATIPTIALPNETAVYTVPATGPYTLAIAGLTADQEVMIQVQSSADPLYLEQVVGAAAVAAGKFKVSAGSITLDVAQAGKTVVVYFLETKTGQKVIGGTAPRLSYGNLGFRGVVLSTRTRKNVWFPKLSYKKNISQEFGGKSEVTLEYSALVPDGWPQPYAFWDAAA